MDDCEKDVPIRVKIICTVYNIKLMRLIANCIRYAHYSRGVNVDIFLFPFLKKY